MRHLKDKHFSHHRSVDILGAGQGVHHLYLRKSVSEPVREIRGFAPHEKGLLGNKCVLGTRLRVGSPAVGRCSYRSNRMHDESFAALDIAVEAALQFDVVEIDSSRRCGRPRGSRHYAISVIAIAPIGQWICDGRARCESCGAVKA